jgi:ketosteroid isomerase-like protein
MSHHLSRFLWIGIAIPLVVSACAPAGDTSARSQEDRRAIAEASLAFSAAYVAGDTVALGALYTEDAVLMPPNRNVEGNAQIRAYFAPVEGRTQVDHELVSDRLLLDGDLAIDMGTWSSTTQREGEEPRTSSERYLVVWQRQGNGGWKMAWDAWHWPRPGN